MRRLQIIRILAATGFAGFGIPLLPADVASADDAPNPFSVFVSGTDGGAGATGVATQLDAVLNESDAGLASTLAADVADPSKLSSITASELAAVPGTDNAFGDLLPTDATATQIAEANALDYVLYSGLSTAGKTAIIDTVNTDAGRLVSVVPAANEQPFVEFATAVGNPDAAATVLDANLDPNLAATLAAYVADPSSIPTEPTAPRAEDAFLSLLPTDATAAQIAEANALDNVMWALIPNQGAESAFYAPSVTPALNDPFSDFATTVGSGDSASGVAGLDATLVADNPAVASVLNGYVDGILSPPSDLTAAPAGDDPFTALLAADADATEVAEAAQLDDALYTALSNAGDPTLAATLGSAAAALTSGTLTGATLPSDPFTQLSVDVSSILSPPGVAGLDGDFIKLDPSLAATFAGYVSDPSSMPTTDVTAPTHDDAFALLLPTDATAAEITEAANLDNLLFADNPTVAAELSKDVSALIPVAGTTVTPTTASPLEPIALLEQDYTTITANLQALATAGAAAQNTLLDADTAALSANLQTALEALTLQGSSSAVTNAVTEQTLGGVSEATAGGLLNGGESIPIEGVHEQVFDGLVGQGFGVPSGIEGELIAALDDFAASPVSGVLMGILGPVISPEVALYDSFSAIVTDLNSGAAADALTELEDAPINVVNSFFDGATLNLDSLAPVFESFVNSGDNGGESITGLSVAFGGLLSTGSVVDGVGGLENGVGGSLLNSIGLDLSFTLPDDDAGAMVDVPAIGVGPIAAIEGLTNIIGEVFNGSLLYP